MRQKNIKIQLNQRLDSKLRIGTSRHEAKQEYAKHNPTENKSKSEYVHSVKTAENYRQVTNQFAEWVRDNRQDVWNSKDLNAITKEVAYEYLRERQDEGIRATSISRDLAALNKLLNLDLTKKEGELRERSLNDISRSRNESNERLTDTMRENNREQILMAQATGMRRESVTTVEKVNFITDKETGQPVGVWLTEKGGKERVAPVLVEYREELKEILDSKPENGAIFDSYSTRIDNHSYRAEYAENRYTEVLNSMQEMGKEIVNDYRGYCSEALEIVSHDLGHNRINVVVEHYLGK